MYRSVPGRGNEWLKDKDGTRLRRPLGYSFYLSETFASNVARRNGLRRCVELGELHSVEVPERDWSAFLEELLTLARFVNEIDSENPKEFGLESPRIVEQVTSYDAMIAAAIDFMKTAEGYRGQNYTISVASA
ncbi:MAG TPA: hypothetical protein VGR35_12010 [Tepidisphaeraceae bacterium]|nr:hypothetical protein [Tepidisphaeraceae bacterium]